MYEGKKCIVRCDRAGVFFAEVASRNGQEAELRDARRLYYWAGATDCLQLAQEGVKKPDECKFTISVPSIIVTDVIEVIPCTPAAIESLDGVKVWKI